MLIDRLTSAAQRHEYLAATAAFGVLACLWFWPLLEGEQIGQAYTYQSQVPWRASAPTLTLPQRAIAPDVAQESYPWIVVARDQLAHGHLPLWNPYEYGGMTLVGNMQSALFFPLTWVLLILPLGYAWGVVSVLKLVLGGLGTYAFSRELHTRWGGALLAGTVYVLSAPFMVWLQWPVTGSYVVLPWLLLATTRLLRRGDARSVAFVALATALMILAGHPESGLIAISATAVYVVVMLRGRLLSGWKWLAGTLLGALAGAVAILPFLQAYGPSVTRQVDYTWGSFPHLPVSFSLDYVLPDLFGTGELEVYGDSYYNAVAAHFGVPALVLALVAAIRYRRQPAALALAAVALVTLLTIYGVPPVRWIVETVPPWSKITASERAYFVVALVGAVGAGAGFSSLSRRALPVRSVLLVVGGVAVVTLFAFALADIRDVLAAPADVKVSALVTGALWLVATAALLLAIGRTRPGFALAGTLVLAVVSLVELQNFNVVLPPDTAYPRTPAAITALQRQPGVFRVGIIRSPGGPNVMTANAAALYGLEAVEGYDFPLSKRWSDFQGRVLRFPALRAETARAVDPPTSEALVGYRMVNTRFYLAPPGQPSPRPEFETVYSGDDATLFRDPAALPRAYVVPRTVQRPYEQAVAALADGSVDVRREALVAPGASPALHSDGGFRPARVERPSPDHVRVVLDRGPPGWLVLANSYCSCWKAEVDGRETPIEPTDVVAMGVSVPAGARVVDFRLDRSSFWLGAALSLVGFAGIAGLAMTRSRTTPP